MHDVVDPCLLKMFYAKGQGKRPHLVEVLKESGVDPRKVLFLDDNIENIRSVKDLGITAYHVKDGLSEACWRSALQSYSQKQ